MSAKNTIFFIMAVAMSMAACKKPYIDPAIEGAWVEVDPVTKLEKPYGCEFAVGESNINDCGNTVIVNVGKTKIWADGGQIWYQQKIAYIKTEEYLYDYKAEGGYMWIKSESTDVKTDASINGKLYKRQ